MTLTELINTTRFYLGNITSTEYSDANITAALNRYYQKAISRAIQANGQWEVNGEVATTDIIAGQQEYVLNTPVPLLALKRIEINLTGNPNDWSVPDIIDMRNYGTPLSNSNLANMNREYQVRLFDNSIFFINTPTVNSPGGLKIYYQTQAVALSASGDKPNLVEEVQTYLINGACYDYCRAFDLTDKMRQFYNDMALDLQNLDKIYSNRLPASRPRITTTNENYK